MLPMVQIVSIVSVNFKGALPDCLCGSRLALYFLDCYLEAFRLFCGVVEQGLKVLLS